MTLYNLVGLGVGAGADLDVFIAHGECSLDDPLDWRYSGGQLEHQPYEAAVWVVGSGWLQPVWRGLGHLRQPCLPQ